MPSLFQGRIVVPIMPIPDPNGQNAKPNRKFVVISSPKSIQNGDDLQLVAISSDVGIASDDLVPMKYGRGCHTGLARKSNAVTTWTVTVSQSDVEVTRGLVKPSDLEKILIRVHGDS